MRYLPWSSDLSKLLWHKCVIRLINFAACNGCSRTISRTLISLLADYMPFIYCFPVTLQPYMEPVSPAPASSHAARHVAGGMPTIPPHSLIAFGLFLRLPGYAEVLLKERKKAQCLLRLVLGVTDDGDGGETGSGKLLDCPSSDAVFCPVQQVFVWQDVVTVMMM